MGNTTSKIDINWDKQDRHIKGTKEYDIAVQSGKIPSVFMGREAAEKYVTDAWLTGDRDESRPGASERRMQTYKEVVGYDLKGNPLHQVKVVDSRTGKHGYPCGDGKPGQRSLV